MSERSGIIYQLDDGTFGLAIHKQQHEEFKKFQKVYVHLFSDRLCTQPILHPENKKKTVTLKHISKLTPVGFSD
jgi:hypothetical protein